MHRAAVNCPENQLDLLGDAVVPAVAQPLCRKSGTAARPGSTGILRLAVARIDEDPANPRTAFPQALLYELAADIRRRGILMPLVVHSADAHGRHKLHFGAMRLRAAILAGLRYISKSGRLPFEDDRGVVRDGQEALRDLVDQWRCGGGRIPERSERREAVNIMLSMPAVAKAEIVRTAAREFAAAELGNHRFVMVLHTHQAKPHVHLAVRAEGRDGRRLNPRKQDLRRWREVFAEKVRGWGIEAEASPRITRGSRHHNERLWERKAREQGRVTATGKGNDAKLTAARRHKALAWCEIAKALASSDEQADRELGRAVDDYARWLSGVRYKPPERQPQRELPGLERTQTQRTRPEPGSER